MGLIHHSPPKYTWIDDTDTENKKKREFWATDQHAETAPTAARLAYNLSHSNYMRQTIISLQMTYAFVIRLFIIYKEINIKLCNDTAAESTAPFYEASSQAAVCQGLAVIR